jgi:hypothetical protein
MIGEYIKDKSLDELADMVEEEDASGKSLLDKISDAAGSGWDGLVDALDEVEEALKDWEPSGSPFGPVPVPGGVPVPVP